MQSATRLARPMRVLGRPMQPTLRRRFATVTPGATTVITATTAAAVAGSSRVILRTALVGGGALIGVVVGLGKDGPMRWMGNPFTFARGGWGEIEEAAAPPASLVELGLVEQSSATQELAAREQRKPSRPWRVLRAVLRTCWLSVVFAPTVLGAPFFALGWLPQSLDDLYWFYTAWAVEKSGPALVKLSQWLSTRRDLFTQDFCNRFVRLQDDTRPHNWAHTEYTLDTAFGLEWRQVFEVAERDRAAPIGSGCIAQVYKGTLSDGRVCAIKVIHPHVIESVEADLDLIRWSTRALEALPILRLHWLGLCSLSDEFARLLIEQMDLRKEGKHLAQLRKNFEELPRVTFPQPLCATQNVLLEEFVDARPIREYMTIGASTAEETAKKGGFTETLGKLVTNENKLSIELGNLGMEVILKMMFVDNYVHGDMHPGNIFVKEHEKAEAVEMVILDAGIVSQMGARDHKYFMECMRAVVRQDHDKTARVILEHSVENECVDEERFVAGVRKAIDIDETETLVGQIGPRVTGFFHLCTRMGVQLSTPWLTFLSAVEILEGVALQLDRTNDILMSCLPILFGLGNPLTVSEIYESKQKQDQLNRSGGGKGQKKRGPGCKCVFPFIYDGKTYNSCTTVDKGSTPWCAVGVTADGVYDGTWAECKDCASTAEEMLALSRRLTGSTARP